MQHKIAAIGNKETLVLFESLGIDCFFMENPDEVGKSLKILAGKDYSIIFLAENLAPLVEDTLAELARKPLPAVTIIPMQPKSTGLGLERIRKMAVRATGTNIV
ncbi:MAG: V-type ATP synthase subunit F [Candidatus Wallbacteria bacterium]|nr:V-type ATP synthase subunit F [Candidatus Wallbacteria bacterium]